MNDNREPTPTTSPSFSIKCNVKAPHRFMRMRALCWILNINQGGGGDRVEVEGITRGGRRCQRTWVDSRDLTNFRAAWIPDHIRKRCHCAMTKKQAESLAKMLNERYGDKPIREHAASFGLPS